MHKSLMVVSTLALTLFGCASGLDKYLRDNQPGNLLPDILRNRFVLPKSPACDKKPGLCAGGFYALVAAPNQSCDELRQSATIKELQILEFRANANTCEVEIITNDTPAKSCKATGKFFLDLSYVIGSTNTNIEYAYDIRISEPVTARQDPGKCVIPEFQEKVINTGVHERTCNVFYIPEVSVLFMTSKQFESTDVKSNNSYLSLFKLGGQTYSERSDSTALTINLASSPKDLTPIYLDHGYTREKGSGYILRPSGKDFTRPFRRIQDSDWNTRLEPDPALLRQLGKLPPQ